MRGLPGFFSTFQRTLPSSHKSQCKRFPSGSSIDGSGVPLCPYHACKILSILEQLKKVLAMSANGSMSCCAQPGALVVVAALPLCQAQVAFETAQQKLLENVCAEPRGSDRGLRDEGACDSFAYDAAFDGFLSEAFPLRCACVMDCSEAVSLVQEVGHVVL